MSSHESSVARAADVIATKWTPLILQELAAGEQRFCELERALGGISPRTLTARLRSLETAGVVCHQHVDDKGRSLYRLTTMGNALLPVVAEMRSFGEQWQCASPLDGSARRPDRVAIGAAPDQASRAA